MDIYECRHYYYNFFFTYVSVKELFFGLCHSYYLKKLSMKQKSLKFIGKFIDKYICFGRWTVERPKEPKYFTVLFFSFEPIYRAFFTLSSGLGLFVNADFYTFCLIYILLHNDILNDILSSMRAAGWCIF